MNWIGRYLLTGNFALQKADTASGGSKIWDAFGGVFSGAAKSILQNVRKCYRK
jgi:hypothetical protein